MKLKRRFFIKGIFATTISLLGFIPKSFSINSSLKLVKKGFPDLIAIKDGSPAQMFDVGIKAFGGMERFVQKGQTVLIKPNIGWNRTPTEGANTQPDLVGKIIELSYKAGASKVWVFDNTCNNMESCYKNSGIKDITEKSKGVMLPSDKEKYYRLYKTPNNKILKESKVFKEFMDADVVINVPVLKNHAGARMTASIKNLMGVIWDRRFWHREGLHQCIGEFAQTKKVNLTVIDAYTVMFKNGPRGISHDDLILKRMQLISTDMVLADTAAAKILGLDPNEIKYLEIARDLKLGSMNLKKANIKKISVKV